MKMTWNTIGKMTVYSLAAAMMVVIGTKSGITARAEMVIDNEEIQAVQEIQTAEEIQATEEIQAAEEIQTVQEMVPESDNTEALPEYAPAAAEMPEAGGLEIDLSEVVVIEDDMIPGAALPDFGFSSEGESAEMEADAGEVVAEDAADAQEAPAASPETCISGTLTYEDEEVAVTVIASEAAQLPANTEVKVTRLEEGSEKYEAAKEAALQGVESAEDVSCVFYDVTLESEGQVLAVEEGTVSVRMEFKGTESADQDVVCIEETESGKVVRNVTDTAAGRTGSVAVAY